MGAWNDHDTVTAPSLSASAESDMDLSMPVPTVDPKGAGLSDFLTGSCIRRLAITGVMSEMCAYVAGIVRCWGLRGLTLSGHGRFSRTWNYLRQHP
jgi:hypothetical protein